MCEFCVRHGEGKKWYENMTNYSRELFLQVNSDEKLKKFLGGFGQSMLVGQARAQKWKRRLPFIYNLLVYPWLTHRQKKSHFGQVLPVEDVELILEKVSSVVRLPCICRKVNTGKEIRVCYAVGMDATHVFKDLPDFQYFDRISVNEAKLEMRKLDEQGLVHSVWTFQTPFIGAICNCDHDCTAYRVQCRNKLATVMWRAEYVAAIDPERCNGCRLCLKQCQFHAIGYNRVQNKCTIRLADCYGCGNCRVTCVNKAISLLERKDVETVAGLW
ncbi:MAG: 4Fe-4S binding protein [Desulfobulbaceae bacterium]|nr:4Fe-4S binding protein [Desulfobulbaceae bacterium]